MINLGIVAWNPTWPRLLFFNLFPDSGRAVLVDDLGGPTKWIIVFHCGCEWARWKVPYEAFTDATVALCDQHHHTYRMADFWPYPARVRGR